MHAYLCSLTSHIQSRGSVLSTLESRRPEMRWAGCCPCFVEGLEGVVCESRVSSLSKTVTVSSVLRQDQRMQREFGSAQNGSTVWGRMHCFDKCNKHYGFSTVLSVFVQAQVRTYTRRLSHCTHQGTVPYFHLPVTTVLLKPIICWNQKTWRHWTD